MWGFIWSLFLIRHLNAIGVWFGEDERTNMNGASLKDIGHHLQISYLLLHTQYRTQLEGTMYSN